MSSPHAVPFRRLLSFFVAAAFFAAVSASAQLAPVSNPTSSPAASANESSSAAESLVADGASDGAAPAATGAGAAQEDHGHSYHSRNFSSHLAFEAGGGGNGPVSDSNSQITWGGNLTVGGGWRFNPWLSALVEYQFIDDKLPGSLIAQAGATGGNAHIWSFSIDPVVDLMPKSHNSIYVTGGDGFYRKVTNFTDPEPAEYCTYFYCGVTYEPTVVGHYSSNQNGWNIGAGFSHRFGSPYGDESRMKIFAEVRYLEVMSPAVTTQANGLGTTTVSADTKLIPITLGVRF